MRVSYEAISLYSPNRAPCAVDLGDNTNLWGLPPSVRRLMEGATDPVITRYPQAYADDLKRAIAEYVQLPVECVVTGCGSDDVLDSAIRAFVEPGQLLAYPDPSFAMVEIFARMNGLVAACYRDDRRERSGNRDSRRGIRGVRRSRLSGPDSRIGPAGHNANVLQSIRAGRPSRRLCRRHATTGARNRKVTRTIQGQLSWCTIGDRRADGRQAVGE